MITDISETVTHRKLNFRMMIFYLTKITNKRNLFKLLPTFQELKEGVMKN